MKRFINKSAQRDFGESMELSALLISLLFLFEFLDRVLPYSLANLGIVPRTSHGLIGIVFSPFLHASGAHLLANAIPLMVLLILLFWDRHYRPELTLGMIWLGSGLGTWLIGRGGSAHIGASGIIYGLVVYLIAAAWWMRSWRSAVVAIGVFLLYGGIWYGLVPQRGVMSWEGHLSGALAGFWAARVNHG